jgi:hypothetical protein
MFLLGLHLTLNIKIVYHSIAAQLNLPRIQFAVEEKQEPNELSEYM